MDRAQLVALVLAALAIIAIVGAAQTLVISDDPATPGADDPGEEAAPIIQLNESIPAAEDSQTEFGVFPYLIAGLVLAVLLYLVIHDPRAAGKLAVAIALVLLVTFVVLSALTGMGGENLVGELAGDPDPEEIGDLLGGNGEETDGDGEGPTDDAVTVPPSAFLLLGALGGLLLLAIASLRRTPTRPERVLEERDDEAHAEADVTSAFGVAAGEIADRIEQRDSWENQVYRAWYEMTALLEVEDPATKTPADFAAAATAAGIRPADVEALTTLFEEVRYGGYEPTAEREERAIDTFRAIERRYAPEADRA